MRYRYIPYKSNMRDEKSRVLAYSALFYEKIYCLPYFSSVRVMK